jgi:nucleoside 2-deoxyribosyltransferase
METDTYVYTGPMFQSCDHGCSHGPNTHGATAGCDGGATQKQILIRNNHAIDNADLVFAYITHADCYGTLIEIGQAAVLGKRVVVAFATGFEPKPDFWYAAYSADIVYDNVNPCCIPNILAGEIDRLNQSSSLGPRETE